MPTRQQIRARQHQQRRGRNPVTAKQERQRAMLPPAHAAAAARGHEGLRRFADACDAYETDMAAAFRACQDAVDEARADCERKIAEANAEYDRAHAAAAAAYAQRTADSHKPEPDSEEEPGVQR